MISASCNNRLLGSMQLVVDMRLSANTSSNFVSLGVAFSIGIFSAMIFRRFVVVLPSCFCAMKTPARVQSAPNVFVGGV